MKYLILFTINPVQSFISQARKSRDLYDGSKLLSDLIRFAAEEIYTIFPVKNLKSLPNRFLGTKEFADDAEAKAFVPDLEQKVRDKYLEISAAAISKKCSALTSEQQKIINGQINSHLQIQWTAIPYDPDKYQAQFDEIESLLGAVKNIRAFAQLEETGRKCSLCGERNLVFCAKGSKNKLSVKPNWNVLSENDDELIKRFNKSIIEVDEFIEQSEGLCAVCFTKRFYSTKDFPSTAKIALMDTDHRISESKVLTEFKEAAGKDFDYQLLFAENLNARYFIKQNIAANPETLRELHRKVKKTAEEANAQFSPYYALIMFDGDSMGKWLAGKELKPGKSLKEFHENLSGLLGEFAVGTEDIVIPPRGRIVYAGGEDFLAFVNLNHLFIVLKKLREFFNATVNNKLNDYKNNTDVNLTFTAGIVIAHYKAPLSDALNTVRSMEKEAKNLDGKNAFSIAVLKHSGEINKTAFHWGTSDDKNGILGALELLTGALAEDKFSNTFIKALTREFGLLSLAGTHPRAELIKAELQRLLLRAYKVPRMANENRQDYISRREALITKILDNLMNLYPQSDIDNFFNMLNICEFISRHLNGGKK